MTTIQYHKTALKWASKPYGMNLYDFKAISYDIFHMDLKSYYIDLLQLYTGRV